MLNFRLEAVDSRATWFYYPCLTLGRLAASCAPNNLLRKLVHSVILVQCRVVVRLRPEVVRKSASIQRAFIPSTIYRPDHSSKPKYSLHGMGGDTALAHLQEIGRFLGSSFACRPAASITRLDCAIKRRMGNRSRLQYKPESVRINDKHHDRCMPLHSIYLSISE